MVSTPLKNISQNGNLPQTGMNIKIFETTTQVDFDGINVGTLFPVRWIPLGSAADKPWMCPCYHPTFQVPKMEESSLIKAVHKAYVRETPFG